VGNRVISQAVHTAREKVLQGGMLHKSLQATGEFSPLVIRMISIGETTGNLEHTLSKVCQSYDQEIPGTIKKILTTMEPLLIVFLAMVVLTVALSIYLPIFSAIGGIGK
ncbi:MAG: type II secretion system F family protein, partial [Candidatus Latescibacterota bacterium]